MRLRKLVGRSNKYLGKRAENIVYSVEMKYIRTSAIMMAGIVGVILLLAQEEALAPGDRAPEFELPDQEGITHRLSDYGGQKVLVYFYPKDGTPGCTKEACGLRDAYSDYQAADIIILGISYDDSESHQKFRDEHNLPFTLLSDLTKEVAAAYETKGRYPLASRRSFLIDEEGQIIHIIRDVDVTTHSQDVLRLFREAETIP